MRHEFAWVPLLLIFASTLAAAPVADLPRMLDEAEAIRKTEKERSRKLLDEVERSIASLDVPLLTARTQLLECKWADVPDLAIGAANRGLEAEARAPNPALRAKLLECRGNARQFAGAKQEAEADYVAAHELARQAGDRAVVASLLGNLGVVRYERGAMADALASLQAAYRLNQELKDEPGQLICLGLIANVYADAKVAQYDRAIEYYRQLLDAYERAGSAPDIGDTLYNMGSTYETKGNLAAAEIHYRRALVTFEKLGRAGDIAFTKRSLGSSLTKQGRPAAALPFFNDAVKHYEGGDNEQSLAIVRQSRGVAYRRLGRSAEALRDLSMARAYFEREKNSRFLERISEEMALAHAQLGEWQSAYESMRRYGVLQQELAAARRDEVSSRLRVEFDTEKTERENAALARENALRSQALREAERGRTLLRIVIVLTALLAFALAVLFWRQLAHSRRLRVMAMTDELTRLPNRRHILALAGEAIQAAARTSRPLSLVAFDIDRFKRINDTFGHASGDTVLRNVARTCRMTLRPTDHIGRVGGEEFLIVLPDTDAAHAREVAERLRAAVERTDFSSVDPSMIVTISLGVVTDDGHRSIESLTSEADELLYRAKDGGRNRVETAA